jgi:reticulon-4-interacting protein 1, mitochondrial
MAFKAWSYSIPGYPSCLSLNPIDLPHPPKENGIHIRVQAAALNPVDVQLMNLPIWYIPGLRYQKGTGGDFSGEVLAVGSAVTKWKLGGQVWGFALSPVNFGYHYSAD